MPIVLKSENLKLLEPSGSVQACNGIALLYLLQIATSILRFLLKYISQLYYSWFMSKLSSSSFGNFNGVIIVVGADLLFYSTRLYIKPRAQMHWDKAY